MDTCRDAAKSQERRHQCEGGLCSHRKESGRALSMHSGWSRSCRVSIEDRRQSKASGKVAVERHDIAVHPIGNIQGH